METSVNNKCKAFTSLEQSKKLAEILPLKSADQTWVRIAIAGVNLDVPEELQYIHNGDMSTHYYRGIGIPCWSLAALLDVLPKVIDNETLFIETSPAFWHIGYRNVYTARADNPVDACYEMVIKLHELNLL